MDAVLVLLNYKSDSLYSVWLSFGGAGVRAVDFAIADVYSVRLKRQLIEQLADNLLFSCFVSLGMDYAVLRRAVFSKNRHWLLTLDVASGASLRWTVWPNDL